MASRWCRPAGGAMIALLLASATVRADVPPLQPKGYTNDYAGVLSADAVQRVDALAGEVERKANAQIAIVIVKSLDGLPIEDYTNTLGRRWGVGGKDKRGILLLFALNDRRNRVEVGYGLEPILPDGKVGGILRSIRPELQAGNYNAAVLSAVDQIAAVIAQDAGVTLEGRVPRELRYRQRPRGPDVPIWAILLGVVGLLWLVAKVGINPFFLLWGLSGWGGSGGGRDGGRGGGWDGGGFSGFGGGDFGGGGASSDW